MSGATAMTYISAAGVGMSAMGAANQANTQKNVLGYQAAVANNNATIANYQAQQETVIGAQQEQASRIKTANLYGAQRASMAANGIDLGEGTATDVLTSTEYMGERDALTIRDNAARRAWAYKTNAQNYTSEASADSAMGSAINPTMSAAGSLLTGAAGLSKSWGAYTKATSGKGV